MFKNEKNKELFHGILAIIILVIFGVGLFFLYERQIIPKPTEQITNFEECVKAGYSIGESHPRQCWTLDGRRFVEETEEIISPEEYYGSSTYGQCQQDNDCFISGCNSEICQSRTEEPLVSICLYPNQPTPQKLNYGCRCVDQKCQWEK